MYPDHYCHACRKKGIDIVEDTTHMLECPSRDDAIENSEKIWDAIYEKIRKKRKGTLRNPRLLKPFGLPTERLLTEHRAAVRRLDALPPA